MCIYMYIYNIYLYNSIISHNIYYLTRYLVQLENTWLENILNILLDSRSARSKNNISLEL